MKTETTIQANPKIQQSEKSQFRQYASYKPSHVEWLGDVPSHWKVDKLKNYCDIFASNVDKKIEEGEIEVSLCNYVDVYKNEKIDKSIDFMIASATQAEIEKFTLQLNDIILTKDSETPDDIAVPAIVKEVFEYFLCGYHLSIIRCLKKLEPDFLIWALRDLHIATQFHREAVGITRFGLASKHFKNGIFAIPSRVEQTAIAVYLDQATANIDQVIATKQKQLEKLEQYKQSKIHECVTKGLNPDVTLKPSGIDWIGDVPGHWKVERIKDVATVVLGKMLCSEDKGSYFLKPYLKSKNIGWNELLLDKVEEMWFSENELENLRVKKNDILMTEGGEVGKTSIWNDELEECYIQNSVHKITFDKKNNPRYYLYLLNHIGSFGVFTHLVSTVSIGHLTKEKLVVVKVVAPTLNEQNEIAKYLDDFCDKISKEKSIIEQQIEKLKQYRKCLIHECVTGKRKVIGE